MSGKSPKTKSSSKTRPGSLTVPSYAFRFNAADDDVEVFHDIPNDSTPPESSTSLPSPEGPGASKNTLSGNSETCQSDSSTPSTPTALSSRFSSKFSKSKREASGKRSLSLDSQNQGQVVPEAVPSSDSWSIFSEIKGKITKTVEEKFRIDLHSAGNIWKKADAVTDSTVIEDEEVEAKPILTRSKTPEKPLAEEPVPINLAVPSPEPSVVDDAETVRLRKTKPPRVSSMTMSQLLDTTPPESPDTKEPVVLPPVTEEKIPVATQRVRKKRQPSFERENPGLSAYQQWLISARKWTLVTFLVLFYKFLGLPSFVDGFIVGVVLMVYTNSAIWQWFRPTRRVVTGTKEKMWIDRTPSVSTSPKRANKVLKVWMNELTQGEYDPEEFHLSSTQSVLIRLEGSLLRLSYPKVKIPKKAMWDEPRYDPPFINQRHANMTDAKVSLLPQGLSRKRYWIRRYPICIKLKLQDSESAKDYKDHNDVARSKYDTLLLFTRSGREKEEWFRRFQVAASGQPLKIANFWPRASASTSECTESTDENSLISRLEKVIFDYQVSMDRLVPTLNAVETLPEDADAKKEKEKETVVGKDWDVIGGERPESVAWLNALVGRCFWDFMRSRQWAQVVTEKIQKKLNKIKVPFWIEDVLLQDIHFGTQMPQVHRIAAPSIDERGLWVDLSMSYYGGFCMTFETKINLLKLKKGTGYMVAAHESPEPVPKTPRLASVCDSDAEESMESSSDDESTSETAEVANDEGANAAGTGGAAALGSRTSKKLLRFVDIIAQSKYFQHATEYKYVKRAMEGVSNTRLTLTVEVHSLVGDVVLNIPPPPTDRIWYGFRSNPSLNLIARPKVGEREVSFSHIVEWIEKKLALEFQKLFVIPNMDDLIIPIMDAWMDPPCTKSTPPAASPEEVAEEAQHKIV